MLAAGEGTMPWYIRGGFGPFRFSQRVGRTPAQRRRAAQAAAARQQERQSRRAAAKRERESRRAAEENAKHVMGEVSGYEATDEAGWSVSPANASVIKFAIEDWINFRTLDLAVPQDKASPGLWDLLAKVHDGAVVKADFPSGLGSSATGEFSLIWNADGTPGPDNDGSPAMMPKDWGNPGVMGFRRWAARVRYEQDLEEAKHTGHLRLDDGEADAWHGVAPSGQQCHHRHRSPEAASECAGRLQQQEDGGRG
jgi:hypothetical protein